MTADARLDFVALSADLRDAASRGGWQLVLDQKLDSTNRRVRALAENTLAHGERVPCLSVAAEQTAGRGRRGAVWQSAPGLGLWFSLVVVDPAVVTRAPPALALAARLASRLNEAGVPATVKWPNDLYLGDAKLGGLLFERSNFTGQPAWLAGVGINWRNPGVSPIGGYPAVGLSDWLLAEGRDRPSERLACRLVEAAVDLMSSPASWSGWIESLRRDHYLFRERVKVSPQTGGAYAAMGDEVIADGRLAVEDADGNIFPLGPNDRVRKAPRQAE